MRPGKKFTIGFLPTLLCLLAMLIAACGGSTTPTTATHGKASANKQVLVSGHEYGIPDIKNLDPGLLADALSNYVVQDVFTGLVQLDDNLNVVDQMAQSHQIMPDGVTYKFILRSGLKFSDGTPLTSQDVVYSINRALDPATQSPTGPYYLKYIKDSDKFEAGKIKTLIGDSLLAPDPNTVIIVTDKKYSFFLNALTYTASEVVEKSLIDKYGKKWTDHLTEGGGDGPFKISKYIHGKEVDLVPNPNYYGAHPQLAKLVYPIYQQAPTVYQAYQASQVDDSYVPSANIVQARTRPDFVSYPILAINYYTMSYTKKPFDNIKIRQAFALAINKDLIVHTVWKDSFIATNHIVPKGQPGYYADLTGPAGVKGTAGDPTLAKQLFQQGLQEAGYSSVSQLPPITLTFASGGDVAVKNEVAALQQMWQNVLGVNVKTNDIDINTLFQDEGLGSNNPLQFYTGPAWIDDYPDPQDWTTLQFDKGAGQNGMNYGQNNSTDAALQQQTQQLLEQADAAPLGPDRLAMYNKAEQQLVNDVAWLPVEQQLANTVRKPCEQGIVNNALGLTPPDDWAKIFISTDTPCVNATV
jgi:oligopeptide transport system substrate-binding protein